MYRYTEYDLVYWSPEESLKRLSESLGRDRKQAEKTEGGSRGLTSDEDLFLDSKIGILNFIEASSSEKNRSFIEMQEAQIRASQEQGRD